MIKVENLVIGKQYRYGKDEIVTYCGERKNMGHRFTRISEDGITIATYLYDNDVKIMIKEVK